MDFRVRLLERGDIDACVELLRGRAAYPDALIDVLPSAWCRLLADDALNAVIVERSAQNQFTLPLAFGANAIVTDAWMADAWSGREPYLTARTIRAELSRLSPILRPRRIQHENAGSGVNIVTLHYAETRDHLPADVRSALRFRMWLAQVEATRGYRLKAVVQEFWDEIDPEYVLNGWGRVLTDYEHYFAERGLPFPPIGTRPHLIGASREDMHGHPGNLAAQLFVYASPRIFFSRAEQRLLRCAMTGSTDLELAEGFGVALPSVKSRWRSIYDRVERMAPEILPEVDCCGEGASRLRERRRRLLEYVRRHPEELRSDLVQRRRLAAV